MAEVLLEWVRDHGVIGVFFFIAIENLGVPWPTSLAFIVAMDLVRTGHLSFPAALAICDMAHVTGALVGYGLGLVGENAIVARARRDGGLQRAIDWLHWWYQRHGPADWAGATVGIDRRGSWRGACWPLPGLDDAWLTGAGDSCAEVGTVRVVLVGRVPALADRIGRGRGRGFLGRLRLRRRSRHLGPAAICVRQGKTTREIDVKTLRERLKQRGASIYEAADVSG